MYVTPELRPDRVMMQGTPFFDIATQLTQPGGLGSVAYAAQEQRAKRDVGSVMTRVDDIAAKIGSVLSNGKLVCDAEGCKSLTFGRQAELRRHHTTLHATNKPNFWCQVPNCRRSANLGGRAFHRKDKLAAHVKSMHPDVQQVYD